jgi:hypothetical protein
MLGRDRTHNAVSPEKDAPTDWQNAVPAAVGACAKVARNIKWSAQVGNRGLGGPHATALTAVESLAKESDGPTLEGLARLCALAAAAGGESYAARAVELLRQAAGKGHRDTAYLKDGSDLTSLHSRADFQNLLSKSGANE